MNQKLVSFIDANFNKDALPVRVIESGQGAYLTIGGKKYLNLCSSHYLGLATDERIKKAVNQAVEKYGIGTGYRTLAGTHTLHVQLEKALAKFKGAEAAIIFSGGYLANCAAIQTIMGKEDIIISDELNHASIIDAVRLSGVKEKYVYRHRDMKHLEEILRSLSSPARSGIHMDSRFRGNDRVKNGHDNGQKILIVTDGVFSMDGDLAPLPEIVALAEKYGAIIMVDDAHGEGVLGRGGRGIVDHFGLHPSTSIRQAQDKSLRTSGIDIEVGTLSKAFSVMGGFITGKKALIDFYKQKARQFLFSSALTIPDTVALLEAVKIISESDKLVKKLWDNTKFLKSELVRMGLDIGHSESPITPIMLGTDDLAVKFASELFEEGIFATSIRFPMVAKGASRIRLIPSAAHSREDLQKALEKIEKVGRELKVI